MAVAIDNPADLNGASVTGDQGTKLGKVQNVYLDNETNQAEWAAVKTGMFGGHVSLVPLAAADYQGGTLHLPYTKDQVQNAPHHDPERELSVQDEQELFTHYGVAYEGDTATAKPGQDQQAREGRQDQPADQGQHAREDQQAGRDGDADQGRRAGNGNARQDDTRTDVRGQAGVVGQDTSGPTTDEAMTRSEEELRAGTQTVQTGTARLRKHVITEQQTVTVPVSHDEVTLEREPITEANRGAATDGPSISEEEHEVTLHAEQPVVATETVAKERVKLGKETVREQQQVSGEVRKEQIDATTTDADGNAVGGQQGRADEQRGTQGQRRDQR